MVVADGRSCAKKIAHVRSLDDASLWVVNDHPRHETTKGAVGRIDGRGAERGERPNEPGGRLGDWAARDQVLRVAQDKAGGGPGENGDESAGRTFSAHTVDVLASESDVRESGTSALRSR